MERPGTSDDRPWPVFGRAAELDHARRALRAGRGALIVGEAGVGRSALAAEIVAEHSGHGPLGSSPPLVITVPPGSRHTPFAPLATELPAWSAPDGVPDWQRIADHLAPPGRPRLVLVDDVHWLDDASAGLLHQLVRGGRILTVATMRRGQPAPPAIDGLWKDRALTRVDLGPLQAGSVAELLEAVLEAPVEPRTAERLHRRTAGSPQLLRELVGAALESGELRLTHGAWVMQGDTVPNARLVDLLTARLDELDADERRAAQIVLTAAPVRAELLGAMVAPAQVDRLAALGWCSIDRAEGGDVVRIAVPLLAEVLDKTMGPMQRAAVQRDLVDRLDGEQLDRDDGLRLVLWRLDARMPMEVDATLLAADHAIDRSRFGDAMRLARALMDTEDGHARAVLRLGEALLSEGRHVECDAVLAGIADDLDALDDEERYRFTTARAKAWHSDLGRLDEAVELLTGEIACRHDGPLRWGLEAYLAFMLADCGRLEAARPLAAAGIERVSLDPPSALRAMVGAGVVQTLGGRAQDTLDMCERMLPIALEHTEAAPEAVGWVVAAQMLAQYVRGDLLEAEAFGDVVEAFVADSPDPTLHAAVLLYRGTIAGDRGDLDSALAMLRKSAALHEIDNRRGYQAWCFASTARVLAERGDVDGAAEAADRARHLRWPSGQNFDAEIEIAELWVAALRGDLATANAALDRVIESSRREEAVVLEARVRHEAVRAGLDPVPHADALDALATVDQGGWTDAQALHVRGLVENDGDLLTRAGDAFAAMGIRVQSAEAYAQAASAHHRAGSSTRANRAQTLKRAQLSQVTGAATPGLRATATGVGLTPRELAAVELAIAGRSNAEIAAALGMAVRTVESHLQRAYAKLGVRSRRQLADALHSLDRPVG